MGKLKDAYNNCKPTNRQIKKQKKILLIIFILIKCVFF